MPTSAELENNSSQTKYTINKSPKGQLQISRPVCALFVMGAIVLAAVAATIAYFLSSRCNSNTLPEALTEITDKIDLIDKYVKLPTNIEPLHYT